MPKFVKMCKYDFTTFHNAMWKDYTLGSTERGVLGTMVYLPDNWNFSIKGLAKILPDGERKIATALKKIEEAGYLRRVRIYSDGRIVDWEYQFSDEPIFKNTSTENITSNDTKSNTENHVENYVEKSASTAESHTSNVENYVEKSEMNVKNPTNSLYCQNSIVEKPTSKKLLDCCFADVENPDVENQHLENSHDNEILSKQILSKQILSNQSILSHHPSESKRKQSDVENFSDEIDEIDEMDMEQVISDVEEQIYAERLRSEHNFALINEIIEVIASVFVSKQKYRTLSGEKVSLELIRKRLKQLEYEHIDYVLLCLQKNTTKIKNRKNYLLTCLYNAPVSMDGYYENLFNHNYGNS